MIPKYLGGNILKRLFGDEDLITGRTKEEEDKYQYYYNQPYTSEMDRGKPLTEKVPDGYGFYTEREVLVPGEHGPEKVYRSKLGDLGFYDREVRDDGRVCYKIKNDKGEVVTQCAETGNLFTRALGVPTTGDAWTRHGVYGDSLIYGEKDHNKWYSRPVNKFFNSVKISDIDTNNLKNGDIVDLYNEGSNSNKKAAKGRGNSHTGTIYKPYGDDTPGPTYILHNVGGSTYIDPLGGGVFGNDHLYGIMGIRRPGSKEHPYNTKEPSEESIEYSLSEGPLTSKSSIIGIKSEQPKKLETSYSNNEISNIINNPINSALISNLPYKFEQKYISKQNQKPNYFNNIQIQKNWKGTKGTIDEESLKMLESLGINDKNAKKAQIALNNYIKSKGLKGKINVDNAWGEQSKEALKNLYVRKLVEFKKPNIND